MAKYYYKTSEDSETGKELTRFWRECEKVERMAETYAKNMGASEFFFASEGFTGGVEWLVFENPDKVSVERWKEGPTMADGTRIWKPNVTVIIRKDKDGKIHTAYDSPFKKAKNQYKNGHETKYSRGRLAGKHSKNFLTAVIAEKKRMALPVVTVDALYHVLGLRHLQVPNEEVPSLSSLPTFFAYKDEFYVSCDDPSEKKDMELINFEVYRFNQNMALNAQRRMNERAKEQAKEQAQG